MNFNIYLDDQLGERLNAISQTSKKSRNALIREAITLWLKVQEKPQWPEDILDFQGIDDFPAFESHREEFDKINEDPFA